MPKQNKKFILINVEMKKIIIKNDAKRSGSHPLRFDDS